jgi:hypothetical protein
MYTARSEDKQIHTGGKKMLISEKNKKTKFVRQDLNACLQADRPFRRQDVRVQNTAKV